VATATASTGSLAAATPARSDGRRGRRILVGLLVALAVLVLWEGAKFLGGTPWRAPLAQPGSPALRNTPFHCGVQNAINLH
jgi:hypothetical protein